MTKISREEAKMKKGLKIEMVILMAAVFHLLFPGSFLTGESIAAEKKIFNWKFSSHTNPGNKSIAPCQLWWCQEIEKRSGGQIKVRMYWTDELNGPKEMLFAVRSRLAEVVGNIPSYTPGDAPIWSMTFLPFICPPRVDQSMVLYNRLGRESKPFIDEMNKFNCVYGGVFDTETRNLMGKKPVRSLGDLKGMRIRCQPDQGIVFKQFGAVPVSVPVTEMYSALDTGIVDLTENSRVGFRAYKVDEISKYLILDMDLSAAPTVYFINKNAWNELPDDLKMVVQSVIDDLPAYQWDFHNQPERVAEIDKVIKGRNIEVIHFPKADRAKLEAKAEAVWEAWAKRSGDYEVAKQALRDYLRIRDEVVAKYPQGVPGIKNK